MAEITVIECLKNKLYSSLHSFFKREREILFLNSQLYF